MGPIPTTTLKGRRVQAYDAYLRPLLRKHKNLHIEKYAQVVKVRHEESEPETGCTRLAQRAKTKPRSRPFHYSILDLDPFCLST